jgi:GDP/UDP-N,N'-diacetylbacillosamine 2-epimerase (hydrolysing)
MKIGVLTSSRADFGIYLPLLNLLEEDAFFKLELIAFGTHLSAKHGYTIAEVESAGFKNIHKIETVPTADSPESITASVGKTIELFSAFWANNEYDLIFALGDRYEMFAAVSASALFHVKIAHLHAGETTLGAVDNAYRHAISLFSKHLFVSTDTYLKRAKSIVEKDVQVHNVGALSVDNLQKIKFLDKAEFEVKFGISLEKPTILSTFHPETVSFENNEKYITELLSTFSDLINKYQLIITLPNTDSMGQMIRDEIEKFALKFPAVKIVESFGMIGYLSCMKHCAFLVGNTSSGFVEATFFPKYVINLGERQRGRIETANIIQCDITKIDILKAVSEVEKADQLSDLNIYGDGKAAEKIVAILKSL